MQAAEKKKDYKLIPATSARQRTAGFDNRELTYVEFCENAVLLTTSFAEAVSSGAVEVLPEDPRAARFPKGIVFRATKSEAEKLNEKIRIAGTMFGLRRNGLMSGGPN